MAAAAAAPVGSPGAEVESLLTMLGTSQCQFYRNGSWHGGQEAESHLRMKYDYMLRKGSLTSADQFIDEVATRSSLSGEPYAVRCGAEPPQPSATWLKSRLQARRG